MNFKLISNLKFKISNSQQGFAMTIITFFILLIMLSLALSMSILIFYRQRISTNIVKSTQSYYAAESGTEDALMRLKDNPSMAQLSYALTINNATTNVVIPDILGGSRVITSQGNAGNVNREIEAVYSLDGDGISFFYGAQVGDGGLTMNNGSRIMGSVFSNGNVSGGNGTIDNDLIVAGNSHSIDDITVSGNATAHSCLSPALIEGNLTYVTGGTRTCTVEGTISTQSAEIADQPLPISQTQINEWKAVALAGGTVGNTTINGTQSLGPKQVNGSLTLSNNAILNVTGTIYVTGNITMGNSSTIKLDSAFGGTGGVVVSDGLINTGNNSIFNGSGQVGSYVLILSTNTSDSAIVVSNNAAGAVFYTSAGGIEINNNVQVKEVTGYKILLNNNAVVQYDSGLANTFFSSGPSGGWKVTSWAEK